MRLWSYSLCVSMRSLLEAGRLAQHVTVTPFRVVDEINQGMDRINERKVFIQMVDAACRPGTPQCFMFTPKLLPDLPYTYDVMPMTIFNGLHNEELTADLCDVSLPRWLPCLL